MSKLLALQVIPAPRTRAEKVAPVSNTARRLSAVAAMDAVGEYARGIVTMELARGVWVRILKRSVSIY